jgi:glutamate--cysteine ligase
MARDVTGLALILSRDDLVSELERGCKERSQWRIGTEHEKIPFRAHNQAPVPYEGEAGIRALLEGMAQLTGWDMIMEGERPIGLSSPEGSAISLEPGGQFELSGAPLMTLHQTLSETQQHLEAAKTVGQKLGIAFLDLGHAPVWTLDETPVMPKGRYAIMSRYMPKVGSLGRDMMFRTATIQANFDFASEADMVQKLRVSLALQPVATALFANSPFWEGKPSGYLSRRSAIWLDTDKGRTGSIPFAFEEGMGFERYVDYALDVPMYFLKRGSHYHDVAGASFRDFLSGQLPGFEKEPALRSDWANHLSTLFPDVRLKNYLEMRGADMGPLPHILALPAFWTGLLYHQPSLDAAFDMIQSWDLEAREALRRDVRRLGLQAMIKGRKIQDIARDLLNLSHQGLKARTYLNARHEDETIYLAPLDEIVQTGHTRAEKLLQAYETDWKGSVALVFEHCTC